MAIMFQHELLEDATVPGVADGSFFVLLQDGDLGSFLGLGLPTSKGLSQVSCTLSGVSALALWPAYQGLRYRSLAALYVHQHTSGIIRATRRWPE